MNFCKKNKKQFSNLRIVIPNLTQYKDATPQELSQLKYLILQRLRHHPKRTSQSKSFKSEFERGLQYYCISLEHHANGIPHLDILLIYQKSIQRQFTDYDYLLKHGDLTFYRKLNEAILDYGTKEDPEPLSNLPKEMEQIIDFQSFKTDSYWYLRCKMDQDPLGFNVEQYVQQHQLDKHISNWSSIKNKLKDMQVAAANLLLKNKPGFQLITRSLIESRLTSQELKTYDSWSGYQTIVDHLNDVVLHRCKRPFKSPQLFLVGRPNIGKTSLVRQIQKHNSVYHLNVSNWYPNYRDGVYTLFFWDEFKLKGGMSHTDLLKFLQGSPMDLQYKGGSSLKQDNPLIIMTSNMDLKTHVKLKFKDALQYNTAMENLHARITEVKVPPNLTLFILLKLIIS